MLKLGLKLLLVFTFIFACLLVYYYGLPFTGSSSNKHLAKPGSVAIDINKIKDHAQNAKEFCARKGFNNAICFMADMSLPSGRNRLMVYDLKHDSLLYEGLVAHGSCNYSFLTNAQFSNEKGCGCTALGKYKIGYKYTGKFGTAYKLYGLDSSNSNAFDRSVVLHSYYMVPDKETYPLPICNSLGCAMVSANFLKQLSVCIDSSRKPILLWIFD